MSEDTKQLTAAQKGALWDKVGARLWGQTFKLIAALVATCVAVIGGVAGVMYIRDKTNGIPEQTAQTAMAQPHIINELKSINDSLRPLVVDMAVLKSQMAEIIKWKDREEAKGK
jgi:uncharacterized membrane protein